MKIKTILSAIIAAALVGTATASAQPQASNSTRYLCLNNDFECVVSPGPGKQLEINAIGYASLTFHFMGWVGSNPVWTITNAGNHCLRGNGSHQVKEESPATGCSQTDDAEQWIEHLAGTSVYSFENYLYRGEWFGSEGNLSASRIGLYSERSGFYITWQLVTPGNSTPGSTLERVAR